MQIRKAAEDYLEAMLILQEKKGYIRSVEVAQYLGVTKPSVSYATKHLRQSGHITMDSAGRISLTETGMEVAARMLERHRTLTQFLMALGVDQQTAEADACKMEHDISQKTFDAMRRYGREHLRVPLL